MSVYRLVRAAYRLGVDGFFWTVIRESDEVEVFRSRNYSVAAAERTQLNDVADVEAGGGASTAAATSVSPEVGGADDVQEALEILATMVVRSGIDTRLQAPEVGPAAEDAKGAQIQLEAGDLLEGGSVVIAGGSSTQEGGEGGNATLRGGHGDTGGDVLINGGDSLGPNSARGGEIVLRAGDGTENAGGDVLLEAGDGTNGQDGGAATLRGGGSAAGAFAEVIAEGGRDDGTTGKIQIRTDNSYGDSAGHVLAGNGNNRVVWKTIKTVILDGEAQAAHCDPATCSAEDIANALITAGLMAGPP